jgi:hypothetical protein
MTSGLRSKQTQHSSKSVPSSASARTRDVVSFGCFILYDFRFLAKAGGDAAPASESLDALSLLSQLELLDDEALPTHTPQLPAL